MISTVSSYGLYGRLYSLYGEPDRTKFLLKSKKPVRSVWSARSCSWSAYGLYGHLTVETVLAVWYRLKLYNYTNYVTSWTNYAQLHAKNALKFAIVNIGTKISVRTKSGIFGKVCTTLHWNGYYRQRTVTQHRYTTIIAECRSHTIFLSPQLTCLQRCHVMPNDWLLFADRMSDTNGMFLLFVFVSV